MNALPPFRPDRIGRTLVVWLLALLAGCHLSPGLRLTDAEAASVGFDDSISVDHRGLGASEKGLVANPAESPAETIARTGRDAWAPTSEVELPTAEDLEQFRKDFLQDRLLKREASATIRVSSIEDAVQAFEAEVKRAGGYVVRRTDGTVSVRVPSTFFDEIWNGVRGQGEVVTESETTLDVTEEHRDLEIRIRNLRKAHERLLTLLDGAKEVKDVLEIEKELRRITLEIERLTAQQQNLTRDVAFSLLDINFITYEQPVYAQSERIPGQPSPHAWIRQVGLRNLLRSF